MTLQSTVSTLVRLPDRRVWVRARRVRPRPLQLLVAQLLVGPPVPPQLLLLLLLLLLPVPLLCLCP